MAVLISLGQQVHDIFRLPDTFLSDCPSVSQRHI